MGYEQKIKAIRNTTVEILTTVRDKFLAESQKPFIEEGIQKIERQYEDYLSHYLDFQDISDNLYDGIHITDGKGKILFVNKAYTRTTGIKAEQIVGRYVKDIEGTMYKGSVTEAVIKKRERVNSVAKIFGLNKEVLVTGTPMFDELGELKFVVTNTRDFDELKTLEQQLAKLTEYSEKAREELAYLRNQQLSNQKIAYYGEEMQSTMELVRTVAKTDVTVLITGESGTGKELIADEIYNHSNRKNKPFIKVNCAAIPAELLESELFGYEGGAFTDAKQSGKTGLFELANGGVILLDEIGDMPFALQTKLLRVLQQKELMRIGGSKYIKLDIRVIASTNKNLLEAIENHRFREDLYYRLNVVPVEMKPLRERKGEIPHLTWEFCRIYNKKYGKNVVLDADALDALVSYHWPGNIRELENLVERLIVTNSTGQITKNNILTVLGVAPVSLIKGQQGENLTLKEAVRQFEKEIISEAIKKHGSKRKAAAALGVDHSTLVKKCQQLYRPEGGEKQNQKVK